MSKNIPVDPVTCLQSGTELQAIDCKIEWIVDKLLPKQSITLLHGRGGIGKTWLSLILSDRISKGEEFMGLATVAMPVVYVDFENAFPILVDRVKTIGILDVLFWHPSNKIVPPPKLDDPAWEAYKRLPPGSLIVIDTLRASQRRDENSSQDMASVMNRLKELRDIGFTILLLHHTPKSNDKTYKGSTAISDLADHTLSLHKVKKNHPEEPVDDDEEEDGVYRFGTTDKTRYTPYHLFLIYDPEKGFVPAPDPDVRHLESIRDFLREIAPANQTRLCSTIKNKLHIASKGKAHYLLSKGDGKYWNSRREGKEVIYENFPSPHVSKPVDEDRETDTADVSKNCQTSAKRGSKQKSDATDASNCPSESRTDQTEGHSDVLSSVSSIFPDAKLLRSQDGGAHE